MLVCHCKSVSDRRIREAVRDGAGSRRQVARICAAGTDCGGCAPVVDEIIASEQRSGPGIALRPLARSARAGV